MSLTNEAYISSPTSGNHLARYMYEGGIERREREKMGLEDDERQQSRVDGTRNETYIESSLGVD